MNKRDALRQVVARAMRAPLAWGEFDCCLMPADLVLAVRGIDPGAPWRGRYDTALGCARLLQREGGLLSVMTRGAALAALAPTDAPQVGDVGVVRADTLRGLALVGAVRTSRGWGALGLNGFIVEASARPIIAWSV